ncbi:DUF2147 domain-containing protein [Novosphingobium sp.]|uniref:DUF2147 domain-containing protein n=1 Tax=Novosphingobium sp. TaxID=1874826 RepID=UPI003B51B6C2
MTVSSKNILRLAAICALLAGAADAMAKPDPAVGRWGTPADHGIVDIRSCGGGICGRLIGSDVIRSTPGKKDSRNTDTAKRNRPLKGVTLLSGFHKTANGWDGGSVYNPEDGRTYKATITMDGPNTLDLKGCIVWPACKTQEWHRTR